MKFIILAPSKKVHIQDEDWGLMCVHTHCGQRMETINDAGSARRYASINIPVGKRLDPCERCEASFLKREHQIAVNRHLYPDEKVA